MDIQKSVKQAFEIAQLKEPAMNTVAADKTALKPALIIAVAAAVIGALGAYLFPSTYGMVVYRMDVVDLLVRIVTSGLLVVAGLYLAGYLAEKVFHSKLNMQGYVHVMGYASLVNVLAIYPTLGTIGNIWYFVIFCFVLSRIGKLSVGSIVLLVLLQIVIVGVIAGLASGGTLMGMMG